MTKQSPAVAGKSLSRLQAAAQSIRVKTVKVAAIGMAEIGCEIPTRGSAKLAKTPANMVKARLRPTE